MKEKHRLQFHHRQHIGQRIRFLVGLCVSLLLVGYGVLCIIRGDGYDVSSLHNIHIVGPTVWHGTNAMILGAEYIAWGSLIVALFLLSNPLGWYLQMLRIILFFLSAIVILLATWFRFSPVVIVITMLFTAKLLVIFVLVKWVLQVENMETRD